jgi:hypothetical protein
VICLFFGIALAKSPIPIEQLEDVEAWEKRSRILLDGPDACVEMRGKARYEVILFQPGGWLGPGVRRELSVHGTFSGTLDHGIWTELTTTLEPPATGDSFNIDNVHPMVGQHPLADDEGGSISIGASGKGTTVDVGSGAGQGLGLLDQIIEDIDPLVSTSDVAWNDLEQAIILQQVVPVENGNKNLAVRTVFPSGGPPLALDAIFPKKLYQGSWPLRVALMNAQLHLRSQQTSLGVLPGEESASLLIGVLGWTIGVEQRLSYTQARSCKSH